MSDEQRNGNDNETVSVSLVDRVELTFHRANGTMQISGQVCNNEVALDMCQRAARHFETRCRMEAAQQFAAEQAKASAMAQITRDLMNRRG